MARSECGAFFGLVVIIVGNLVHLDGPFCLDARQNQPPTVVQVDSILAFANALQRVQAQGTNVLEVGETHGGDEDADAMDLPAGNWLAPGAGGVPVQFIA